MWILLLFSLALLGLAAWLALRSRGERRKAGLPAGRLVYADTGRWASVTRPYFSAGFGLTGKPDYLVETPQGLVPVEVKRTSVPPGGRAYDSHVMQLAAYCLLVEEAHGKTCPYGLIRYADATVSIDFTPALRADLLALLEEMRRAHGQDEVARNHRERARCRACGVRHACGGEALP